MSLKFDLLAVDYPPPSSASRTLPPQAGGDGARRGVVHTAHGDFQTPAFMAVGTAATVKALTMDMVAATGTEVILGNTYHLMMRPGGDLIESFGGLHQFSGWHGPILTDSGGFQVKSLAGFSCTEQNETVTETGGGLVKMTEDGVHFTSHIDGGQKHFMSPEISIKIQNQLDSDMTMVLDECLPYPVTHDVAEKSIALVTRWARRSRDAFTDRPGYGIFGIVQGSVFKDLRTKSAADLVKIGFDGYAIGSLTQGEPYDVMLDIIKHTCGQLPADRPRYLMGAGTPIDILGAVERGIDMFDCVMPTRAGRTGMAFTRHGTINIRNAKFRDDASPLDSECGCLACRGNIIVPPTDAQTRASTPPQEGSYQTEYQGGHAIPLTRAYIHHLVKANEILGAILLTQHNLYFYQDLMRGIRTAIERGEFQKFKKDFIEKYSKNV